MKILCVFALLVMSGPALAQPEHNHTPRRGGQLRAAAGDTLHIEGLWPEQRRFKLFVYDAEMSPLPTDRLAGIKGHVLIGDREFALAATTQGYMEARIPTLRLPAAVTVRFGVDEEFRFEFPGYSVENEPFNFILPPTPIPSTLPGLLAALREDLRDAQTLVDGGSYTMAYAPAVRAQDRLLALEPHIRRLPEDRRAPAEAAMLAGLRAAWLMHVIADNALYPIQTRIAFAGLRDALGEVFIAFAGASR